MKRKFLLTIGQFCSHNDLDYDEFVTYASRKRINFKTYLLDTDGDRVYLLTRREAEYYKAHFLTYQKKRIFRPYNKQK